MPETSSAGVYIEEVPSSNQIITAVSTSTMGIVGFAPQGPSNTATLVTSYPQYTSTFGPLTSTSLMGHTMVAFFANGGSQAFVVRVTPSDATVANAMVIDQTSEQVIETSPDGVTTTFTRTTSTTPLKIPSVVSPPRGDTPGVAGSFTFSWRAAGTPVAAEGLKHRDGTTALIGNGILVNFEGRVDPTHIPTTDYRQFAIVPGTTTLHWTDASGAQTLVIPAPGAGFIATATGSGGTAGTKVTLDLVTGFMSTTFGVAPTAVAIQLAYTPATVTQSITDSAGALVGAALTTPGTINYTTGAYSFTTTSAPVTGFPAGATPHNLAPILATYQIEAWTLSAVSAGVWGNDLQLSIAGNINSPGTLPGTFTAFDVNVLQLNTASNTYQVVETYEECNFTDPTSQVFFPDVVNDLSALITVSEPGGNTFPEQLNSVQQNLVIGGGDGTSGTATFTNVALFTSSNLIQPRSVTITYTSGGVIQTIKDDGAGNLYGSIDPSGTNVINYGSGLLSVKLASGALADANTLVTAKFSFVPAAIGPISTSSLDLTNFGSPVAGTDGTFDSTHFGREQMTDPAASFGSSTLAASYAGLYALDRVDEILQVVVPDLAGDAVATGQLLDYADTHAASAAGGDRFIILTTPKGQTPQKAVDWFLHTLGRYSDYAALYWPWVQVSDPLSNGRPLTIPPLGHIAGVYARTDNNKNVGKAPAGVTDGKLNSLIGLEYVATKGERDFVAPAKINPLISSTQTGMAVWGARTISSDSNWRYVNARRLFMFLEKSIYNSTFWVVFENNGAGLWAKISAQLNGFMTSLFQQGYFAGTSPSQAFQIIVDNSNNTPATIEQGDVFISVAAAPNTPAEFVVFQFSQLTLT